MKLSLRGAAFISAWEGVELTAYKDVAGYWTIGVGHLITDDEAHLLNARLTLDDALSLFQEDVVVYEDAVNRHVHVPLPQTKFDALVSWTYNLGESNLKRSTLLRKLNTGLYDAVPEEMARWNRAGGRPVRGLVRRRAAEGHLWSTGRYLTPGSVEIKELEKSYDKSNS